MKASAASLIKENLLPDARCHQGRGGFARSLLFTLVLVLSVGIPEAIGKPRSAKTGAQPASTTARVEKVQARIKAIEQNQELEASLKSKLLDLYRQAHEHLETALSHEANAGIYKQAIASAPAEIGKIRKALERPEAMPATPAEISIAKEKPLAELEQRLANEQAELMALQNKLAGLEKQVQDQQLRPAQIRDELAAARQGLEEINPELKTPPAAEEPPPLSEARKIARQARQQAQVKEIEMLEQELLSHGIRVQLLSAQRDQAAWEVSQAEARVKILLDLITERRESEAQQAQAQAAQAEREAAGKHPAIRQLAEQNAELSQELAAVVDGLGQANTAREAMDAQLRQIEQDFQGAKQKLEIAGLSQALGQVLQEQRRKLPEVRRYHEDARARQQRIGEVGLSQLRVEERRRSLSPADAVTEGIMSTQAALELSAEQRREIETELRNLIKEQHQLLDKLAEAYSSYLRALGDLDFIQRRLVDTAQLYAAFLDERLLWIPSATPLGSTTLRHLVLATGWILSPPAWAQVGHTLILDVQRTPVLTVIALLGLGILMGVQGRLRRALAALAEKVIRPYSDRFILTLQALLVTFVLAMPGPLLVGFLGWRLQNAVDASKFARSVGAGLVDIALPMFFFRSFQLLCRSKGVAELHFRWQARALTLLRRHLPWLMVIALSAVFVISVAGWQVGEAYRDSLGQLAFITGMIALTLFVQRVLRPKGGALAEHLKQHPKGWLARFRYLWYPAAIGTPIALAGLAAAGYYYTALQLESELVATVWLIIGAVIVHDLVIRWLTVANRKLALIKAKEEREAVRTAGAAGGSGDATPIVLDTPEVDIPTINLQTRHLLRTLVGLSVLVGLWFIWAEVFPALKILERVTLWQQTVAINGQETQQSVTLANLALALVFAMIATVAVRNLPGVLEIALLQRLSIEHGSRYAIIQVARYLLVALGIIAVFTAIGGRWSQVQWLVAALGVGLGFGLQEIFANFVSGLIILVERPIRMGDLVTVGEITGTVSRIRIRTTIITDADRRELIVPNKTFITDRLINWTLYESITRIVIRTGVARTADPVQAYQVILDTVRSHPLVMEEPKPEVAFVGFVGSALNFEVRAFVKELEHRIQLTHELHIKILEALRAHNIPYP